MCCEFRRTTFCFQALWRIISAIDLLNSGTVESEVSTSPAQWHVKNIATGLFERVSGRHRVIPTTRCGHNSDARANKAIQADETDIVGLRSGLRRGGGTVLWEFEIVNTGEQSDGDEMPFAIGVCTIGGLNDGGDGDAVDATSDERKRRLLGCNSLKSWAWYVDGKAQYKGELKRYGRKWGKRGDVIGIELDMSITQDVNQTFDDRQRGKT